MFVDEAKIFVKAGNGGNGCIAFRRENMFRAAAHREATAGTAGAFISKRISTTTRFFAIATIANSKRIADGMAKARTAPAIPGRT